MGFIAVAALMASVPAWAAELKIGFVDINRLASESPQAKAAEESMRSEFTPRQRDIQTQQQTLKNREDKLQKDAATMSEDQRTRAEKELRDSYRDLQRKQSEFQDDINARRNEEMQRLQRLVVEEVRTYAKAQNFDLIVTDAIYANQSLDITAAILAALQAHGGAAAGAKTTAPKPQGH